MAKITARTTRNVLALAVLGLGSLGAAFTVARAESGTMEHHGFLMHGPSPIVGEADTDRDGSVDATEWSALFTRLDADKSGKLEASEVPGFHAPPPEALAYMIAHGADSDGDGKVTQAEWQARVAVLDKDRDGALALDELALHHPFGGSEKVMPPPFVTQWDTNGDGKLEASELDALFAAADEDGDGVLTHPMERHHRF